MISNRIRATTLLITLVISPLSIGTLYQWTDEQGRIHYSDQPHIDAKEISSDLTGNVVSSMPSLLRMNAQSQPEPTAPVSYQLTLLSPHDQAVVRANNGQLELELSLTPALQTDDQIQVLLNGQTVQTLRNAGFVTLHGLSRGEHQVQAQIMSKSGKVLASTAPINLTMHRQTRPASARP